MAWTHCRNPHLSWSLAGSCCLLQKVNIELVLVVSKFLIIHIGSFVSDFLICRYLLYLNIKYLGERADLVCTLMAPYIPFLPFLSFLRRTPSVDQSIHRLPIIIDQSVRGESARPVHRQYNYCSMTSTCS